MNTYAKEVIIEVLRRKILQYNGYVEGDTLAQIIKVLFGVGSTWDGNGYHIKKDNDPIGEYLVNWKCGDLRGQSD